MGAELPPTPPAEGGKRRSGARTALFALVAIASTGVMIVFGFAGYGYVADELLLRRLSATDPGVRGEAAILCGKRKLARATPLLIGNVIGIANDGGETYHTILEKIAPFMEALEEIGRPALPMLIDASRSCENPGCAYIALALLGIYESHPSGMDLKREDFDPMHDWDLLWKRIAARDEDPAVRRAARRALERP